MTQQVVPFLFEGCSVRVVLIDGDPWFVGKDVAELLGYSNPQKAVRDHCRAARPLGVNESVTLDPQTVLIPERDVYRLVIRSRLPAAERFEEWVVGEVLPSIRKTGAYAAQAPAPVPASIPSKLTGELALLECYTRLLRPAPSSQVMMLEKIGLQNGLDVGFLPDYAEDAAPDAAGGGSMPTKSLTALLKEHGVKMNPARFNQRLLERGILRRLSRRSSGGDDVTFWSITEVGLRFGKNLTSPACPRETQPHWYVDRFAELLRRVES